MKHTSRRQKGQSGEREVAALHNEKFQEWGFGQLELKRNLMQSMEGGYDLVGLPFIALEVKRQEQYNLPSWWEQTLRQCGSHQTPVLWYRRNRVAWRVRMESRIITPEGDWVSGLSDIDTEYYFNWLRATLRRKRQLGEL